MFKKIKNIKINYKQYGSGEDVILLHGWGQNIQMMDPLGKKIDSNHRVTIIDLPGFGLSSEPEDVLGVPEYADILHELLKELKINNPILIGHSFGGRVTLCYASKYPTKKIVLFGSPCVRHEHKSMKQTLFKVMKKIIIFKPFVNILKKHLGSPDYKNATPKMRDILVKTVNLDLSDYAKKISCEALLIWGENDTAVPVSDAKELDNLLKNSALIVLPGTHYCYLENLDRVTNILNNFI